ncbi:TIGR03752 family integrating conjugative element protein [Hahella ganghwensis]|uniref:TIGR03752 family integrating conjugative element protein n=1 Tax=Hahella ganghwensis TaxID=286420 RepID=UPI000374A72E|nr:TIGR03752 family integrating conjugative element protein [Hahella ganghwensis]
MANKFVPVVVLALFLLCAYMIAGYASKGERKDDPDSAPPVSTVLDTQPSKPEDLTYDVKEIAEAEQSNYLETIQTVAARQETLEDRMKTIDESMSQTLMNDLTGKVQKETNQGIDLMQKQFEAFKNQVMTQIDGKIKNAPAKQIVLDEKGNVLATDMPNGLGFDDLPKPSSGISEKGTSSSGNEFESEAIRRLIQNKKEGERVTLKPSHGGLFDYEGVPLEQQEQKGKGSGLRKVNFDEPESPNGHEKTKHKAEENKPYYTIPANGTLFSNTTMTSLIGIVPKKGKVKDPFRFKVITGGNNIATNGYFLPNVRDIVWSGVVIGNRELSCAKGIVDKVTFTFADGTIRTVTAKDKEVGLGYISDKWGQPCLPGILIDNAHEYIGNRVLVGGSSALSKAAAETNKTTINNVEKGLITTIVDGDSTKFLAGETLSASLGELAKWLEERQVDAIDLVYLQTGQDVTIHVEQQIEIDYETNGRRLIHYDSIAKTSIPGQYID